MGLGRAKTRARCSAVEWRSNAPNVLAVSREAYVTMPDNARARNLENPVVLTLLARGTRHAFLVQCVEEVSVRGRVGIRF